MKGLEMPRKMIVAAVVAAALLGGGVGAAITAATHAGSSRAAATTTETTTVVAPSNVANSELTVGEVAKAAGKSVVEVDATTASSAPFPGSQGGGTSAEGTGFVYDTKGDIVTNEHVIDGAGSVRVKFSDGSTYRATVVGSDTSTDVAVLHVDAPASKLRPLTLADSSKVAVGDGVVAIGNPYGLDNTVTSGIVSATGREISAPDNTPIEGAIQTDAAINHGNSGGPLLDLHGDVIGITSQIQSDSGANDGVGFAVPSNTVKAIASQLIAKGSVTHPLLGVTPRNAVGGVGIATVEKGSGAARAGLKSGDVIVSVNGAAVTQPDQLRAIIAGHKPGDRLTLVIHRGGKTRSVVAILGARPS